MLATTTRTTSSRRVPPPLLFLAASKRPLASAASPSWRCPFASVLAGTGTCPAAVPASVSAPHFPPTRTACSVLLPPPFGSSLMRPSKTSARADRVREAIERRPRTMSTSPIPASPATADLCDHHIPSPNRAHVVDPTLGLRDYGNRKRFHGVIETVRCFESNPLVRRTLELPGGGKVDDGRGGSYGRVLVVDGGSSNRCALLGDALASLASENGWAGVVVNGCVRDSAVLCTIDVGIKARGTHPVKSVKTHDGVKGVTVAFGGVEFVPGHWLYADEDGIIVSETELHLPESKL